MSGRRKRTRDAAPSLAADDSLSLSILSRRIDELAAAFEDVPASVGEKGAFYTILTGMVLLFLGSFFPPHLFKVVVMAAGLLLQVIGFLFWPVLWYRRNRHDFDFSHHCLAAEFDRHFVAFQQLVRWLRRFPVAQREAMLRYVGYRQKQLGYRVGAMTGGFQQLALLPLLVALYFQFKDWTFTGWDQIHINRPISLLVFGLAGLYVTGWLAVRIRIRLDQYEMLLTESLVDPP